jgi:hypothetical protein
MKMVFLESGQVIPDPSAHLVPDVPKETDCVVLCLRDPACTSAEYGKDAADAATYRTCTLSTATEGTTGTELRADTKYDYFESIGFHALPSEDKKVCTHDTTLRGDKAIVDACRAIAGKAACEAQATRALPLNQQTYSLAGSCTCTTGSDAALSVSTPTVNSLTACFDACKANANCASFVFGATSQSCQLYSAACTCVAPHPAGSDKKKYTMTRIGPKCDWNAKKEFSNQVATDSTAAPPEYQALTSYWSSKKFGR